jgi:hypothetical protein
MVGQKRGNSTDQVNLPPIGGSSYLSESAHSGPRRKEDGMSRKSYKPEQIINLRADATVPESFSGHALKTEPFHPYPAIVIGHCDTPAVQFTERHF